MIRIARLLRLSASLAGLAFSAFCADARAQSDARPAAADWSWLKNTYWIVPPAGLPSFLYDPTSQTLLPASDQTVYYISDYRSGYFWGKTVTVTGRLPVNCSSLIGSVTPDGKLLLNFIRVSNGVASQQQGFGAMTLKDGAWTMLNQTANANFMHWAYMVQSRPTDMSWYALPGVGMSVPQFLGQCPGSGPHLGRG